ncbi:hypothetical protein [Nocardia sp. NPDC052566]|uniref:hypothetical protein n=1 Tax=Nocardia sp. NPDC052566 TaxID=3364330 RepID=UPI0037C958BF
MTEEAAARLDGVVGPVLTDAAGNAAVAWQRGREWLRYAGSRLIPAATCDRYRPHGANEMLLELDPLLAAPGRGPR